MKILITGSTGFVGTALMNTLAGAGHSVCRLVRPETSARGGAKHESDVAWNPVTGELGRAAVRVDAVVNLAGASIVAGRWTAERKAALRSSRVDTTRALVVAAAKINPRPRVVPRQNPDRP